ncbi:hypothetical protein OH77DRAFT_1227809 [Trametes cingulata]|nr:hypothetical protein OH77DRAFT_1227809 [Trametes cingulata]
MVNSVLPALIAVRVVVTSPSARKFSPRAALPTVTRGDRWDAFVDRNRLVHREFGGCPRRGSRRRGGVCFGLSLGCEDPTILLSPQCVNLPELIHGTMFRAGQSCYPLARGLCLFVWRYVELTKETSGLF